MVVAFIFFFGPLNRRSYLSNSPPPPSSSNQCFRWCINNTVSTFHIQIRNIERSVNNQPVRQRLGWPGSYCFVLSWDLS